MRIGIIRPTENEINPFVAIRTMNDAPKDSGIKVFEDCCEAASIKTINILKNYLETT